MIVTPTLRPDGSLLSVPGYDPATGLFLACDGTYPSLLEQPTRAEARAALRVLSRPFVDFPFKHLCHLNATLAALLSVLCRYAIWAGAPDPAEARAHIEADSDPAYEALSALLDAWFTCYGTTAVPLKLAVWDSGTLAGTVGQTMSGTPCGTHWEPLMNAMMGKDSILPGSAMHCGPGRGRSLRGGDWSKTVRSNAPQNGESRSSKK